MLYFPGRHLGGAAATVATGVCADVVDVISDWDPEIMTVLRSAKDHTTPIPTVTWAAVGTFTGDWQPVSGKIMRMETGRKVMSEAFIIGPCDLNVLAADKIRKPDLTWMYVNYVRVFRGHTTVYLTKTEGAN